MSREGLLHSQRPGDAPLRPDQIESLKVSHEMAAAGASQEEITKQINEIRAAAGQPPMQVIGGAQPAAQEDPVDKLATLAELRDKGVLTEEEFAAQKARILGGG